MLSDAWRTKRFVLALLAVPLALATQQAMAQQCNLDVQGVNFGNYDPFSILPADSTGNIRIRCDHPLAYAISLSTGSGDYTSRNMTNGSHRLAYNLYMDYSRQLIWGNGASGTTTVSGLYASETNHVIYARIPARQNVQMGSYSDTVTVTVSF